MIDEVRQGSERIHSIPFTFALAPLENFERPSTPAGNPRRSFPISIPIRIRIRVRHRPAS